MASGSSDWETSEWEAWASRSENSRFTLSAREFIRPRLFLSCWMSELIIANYWTTHCIWVGGTRVCEDRGTTTLLKHLSKQSRRSFLECCSSGKTFRSTTPRDCSSATVIVFVLSTTIFREP